jgi:outer membrane receptor protein involved in Fe transport
MRSVLCFLILTLAASVAGQETRNLQGTVLDSTGSPISGAKVEFRSDSVTSAAETDSVGHFSLTNVSGSGTLFVRYPGFATAVLNADESQSAAPVTVTLSPAPSVERIQVTADSMDRISPVPTSQYSIPKQQIQVSGSLSVDEILRQTPGFTLFRRAGSLFANPTTQGVSLRGVGANGTSRAAVLVDGIPLNDPFGGWVYWNRVARVNIASIQVFNGGSSDVYGGGALGGVINIETLPVRKSFATLETSYGNEDTKFVSLAAGTVIGKWGFAASGQALRTGGYIIIPEPNRGLIDIPAGSGDLMGTAEVSRTLGTDGRFFARLSELGESRQNGTPLTPNDTSIPEIDLGLDWTHSTAGSFSLRAYASKEVFHQGFSSPGAGRNSETQADIQRSPSGQVGFAGQWRRTFAGRHAVTAGLETRGVHGDSFEQIFCTSATVPVCVGHIGGLRNLTDAGGRQTTVAFFGQDAFRFAENWMLTIGGRVDTWSNTAGYSYTVPILGTASSSATFPDRRETAFSPRVSLMRSFGGLAAVNFSVYRAFRAPNLNELYRGFRVGALATNPNAALVAERLSGGEAGMSLTPWSERVTLRGNFFWSEISNPVTNVPIGVNLNQRQNVGISRARGLEFSSEAVLPDHMRISAAYILSYSTFVSAPASQPQVLGLWVPQVPRNQFSFQWTYADQNWTAGVQGRFVGKQYDDLSPNFPMDSFFTLDAEISRRLFPHTEIFFGAQNLTNSRYATAETPNLTVGPPTLVRGGFRINFF